MFSLPGVCVSDRFTFGTQYLVKPVTDTRWVKRPRTVFKSSVLSAKAIWKSNMEEVRCVIDAVICLELFKVDPSANCVVNLRGRYTVDEDRYHEGRKKASSHMHRASATIVAASTARSFTDLRIHVYSFLNNMESGGFGDGTAASYHHFRMPAVEVNFLHVTPEER